MGKKLNKSTSYPEQLEPEEFEVQEVLDKRINKDGKVEYFLKWKDYDRYVITLRLILERF